VLKDNFPKWTNAVVMQGKLTAVVPRLRPPQPVACYMPHQALKQSEETSEVSENKIKAGWIKL